MCFINSRRSAIGIMAALTPFLAFSSAAQQIPPQELQFETQPYTPASSLRVQRNVVQIDVVVEDARGQSIPGLTAKDFKLYDKGKEQTISQFTVANAPAKTAPASPQPAVTSIPTASEPLPVASRYIALFFDDRSTPFSDLRYAQDAAKKFVRRDLHEGDAVGVFTASGSTSLDFTTDTQKLSQAIESIHLQPLGLPPPGCPGAPRDYPMGPYAAYLIVTEDNTEVRNLYLCGGTPSAVAETEAIARSVLSSAESVVKSTFGHLEAVIEYLSHMSGHRIVVLASSGFFTSSLQPQMDKIAGDAIDAGVVINTLDAKGLDATAPGSDAQDSPLNFGGQPMSDFEKQFLKKQREEMDDVMDVIAWDTGGIFFHNNNDLDLGLREMAEVPQVSYRLGFSPANLKPDGKFHDLKVKLAIPGSFEVQARRGYFAPTEAAAKAEGQASAFNDEVLKSDELNALPTEVGAQAGRLEAGGTGFRISLHVDPHTLAFKKDHGRHLDKLNLIAALFNSDGKFVTGEMGIVNMALSNKSLDDLNQRGINATIVLPAAEGHYRLRVVMEDAASGRLFATSRQATIP